MIIRLVHVLEDGNIIELDWQDPENRQHMRQVIGLYVFEDLIEPLRERGISFSRPEEPFELSLASFLSAFGGRLKNWDEGPLLIHDHHDIAGLTQNIRLCLRSEKVLGILKPRFYRDSADHEIPVLQLSDGAVPTLDATMLAAGLPSSLSEIAEPRYEPLKPSVCPELLERKIRLVPGYSHAQMFHAGWKIGPSFNNPKPYDSYFAGTMSYHTRLVVLHRDACVDAMCEARRRGFEVAWAVKTQNWNEYMRTGIRSTKTAPSPWGYAAVCFRDFEILMGGAIMVKPDTTFCRGWPDLFHPDNDLYVKCRIDYTDLPDIIADVKCNWNSDRYRTMREQGWEFMEKYHDPDLTADHLADVFHYFEGLA